MDRFSIRTGLAPQPTIHLNSISDELKIRIWNFALEFPDKSPRRAESIKTSIKKYLWTNLFHERCDKYPVYYRFDDELYKRYDQLEWYGVYDFLECYLNGLVKACIKVGEDSVLYSDPGWVRDLLRVCRNDINTLMDKHKSGYRLINGLFTPTSDENEINAISTALSSANKAINEHIQEAVRLLSDRKSPDYRNSIKESISAVESAVNDLNDAKAPGFSEAIKGLEQKFSIHPALRDAFIKIYGYTSDERSGIRHAMTTQSDCIPDFADAKFMLVACSAFINYLLLKAAK